jgi:hypothetical protein
MSMLPLVGLVDVFEPGPYRDTAVVGIAQAFRQSFVLWRVRSSASAVWRLGSDGTLTGGFTR